MPRYDVALPHSDLHDLHTADRFDIGEFGLLVLVSGGTSVAAYPAGNWASIRVVPKASILPGDRYILATRECA